MVLYKHDTISFKKSKIKIYDFIITILLIVLILIILLNPTKYAKSTIDGFMLFAMNVFPTLFPFIFLSKILTSLQTPLTMSSKLQKLAHKIFHAPSSIIYVYFISVLCGYPIGAKLTSDLVNNKAIRVQDAKIFTYYCSTSGVLFVIGTIGTIMFNSARIGIIIYISHIIGCFLGGLILSRLDKKTDIYEKPFTLTQNQNLISSSVSSSINSILIVGAYITLFALFIQILCDLTFVQYINSMLGKLLELCGLNSNLASGIFNGIFEMTNGCKSLSLFASNASVSFASALISFGGISIILQSHTFLQNTQIKTCTLVFTKLVHAIITFIICNIFLFIF